MNIPKIPNLAPHIGSSRPVGYYALRERVINPEPDRRVKRDWRARGEMPTGTEWRVHDIPAYAEEGALVYVRAYSLIGSSNSVTRVSHPELFAALEWARMEPRVPLLQERLDARGLSAEEVLEELGVTDEQLDAIRAKLYPQD